MFSFCSILFLLGRGNYQLSIIKHFFCQINIAILNRFS
ncbi:DUF4896 domain-containing protein [Okeania sp.]